MDDIASKLSLLEQREADSRSMMVSMNGKLDLIVASLARVQLLEEKHANQNEAVARAFKKLEAQEVVLDTLLAFKNKIEGMATMAWLLWTGMGAAMVAMLVKIMFFAGH